MEWHVLDHLAATTQRLRATQRMVEEQQSDRETRAALLNQLGSFQRGVLERDLRTAGNPHIQSPVPAANQPSQDHHHPDDIDDDPASSIIPQESPEDPPATDALAWFASSTPFQERKRPARQPGQFNLARKSMPQPHRPCEEWQVFTVGLPTPPSSDEDELFGSGDEWEVLRTQAPESLNAHLFCFAVHRGNNSAWRSLPILQLLPVCHLPQPTSSVVRHFWVHRRVSQRFPLPPCGRLSTVCNHWRLDWPTNPYHWLDCCHPLATVGAWTMLLCPCPFRNGSSPRLRARTWQAFSTSTTSTPNVLYPPCGISSARGLPGHRPVRCTALWQLVVFILFPHHRSSYFETV